MIELSRAALRRRHAKARAWQHYHVHLNSADYEDACRMIRAGQAVPNRERADWYWVYLKHRWLLAAVQDGQIATFIQSDGRPPVRDIKLGSGYDSDYYR